MLAKCNSLHVFFGLLHNILFLQNAPQDGKSRTCNNLKIVYPGTQEFKAASAMRDLYSEFADHQERLHKKLAFLEGSVYEI